MVRIEGGEYIGDVKDDEVEVGGGRFGVEAVSVSLCLVSVVTRLEVTGEQVNWSSWWR